MKKRKRPPDPGVPEWVVTYGDLMSLLLCFFILLAAFSELKQEREYRKVYEKIREALGFRGGFGVASIISPSKNSADRFQPEHAKNEADKLNTDETPVRSVPGPHDTTATPLQGSRQLIGGPVRFDPGSTELSPADRDMLRSIASQLIGRRHIVQIRGHAYGATDVAASGFADDLELSGARANAVFRFLADECGVPPALLEPVARGSSEPAAVSRSSTEHHASNRRVEVFQTGQPASGGTR